MRIVSLLKHLTRGLLLLALGTLLAVPVLDGQTEHAGPPPDQAAPAEGPAQPVYFYLYSRYTDHVNLDLTVARLRRVLPMLERYRQQHPETHLTATLLFSGAISRALAGQNAKTGIVNYVKDFARRGVVQIGYDGTDEPTYQQGPTVDLSQAKTPEDHWVARAAVAKKVLTEGRDPLTGAPQPGERGGLAEMQEVFGKASVVNLALTVQYPFGSTPGGATTKAGATPSGEPSSSAALYRVAEVGDDRELATEVLRYDPQTIMFGLPDANPARLPGFWASEAGFGKLVSPVPDSSPELYWQDGVLRTTEGSDGVVRVLHTDEGPEGLQKALSSVARSRIRIVHVEFGDDDNYIQPWWLRGHAPLRYAYEHPQQPQVPHEALRPAAGIEAAFAKEDAAMKWLLEDFLQANPGSRFVSSTDLQRMTPPAAGYRLSVSNLQSALAGMLQRWGNDTFPPPYLLADGRYLSLADLFQVMTDALAGLSSSGKLPESVEVDQVYGPLRTLMGHGPNAGEVTVADIAHTCAEIAPRLHDHTASPVPKNTIPSGITVGEININAAQFLRLMAAALVTPSPDAKFRVKMTYLSPGTAVLIPKTRALIEMGGAWTIKPAPLELPGTAASLQNGRAE
jgi:hypothetical protein